MKKFFKYLLTVFLGGIISAVVIFLIFFMILAGFAAKGDKLFEIKENSVYHIKLNRPIEERSPESILDHLNFIPMANTATLGLNDIISNIKKAEQNPDIKGILLDVSFIEAGMATVDDIRLQLEKFKASGKFIVAYGEYMGKKAYYLASVADEIYLNPVGVLEFTGLKSEIHFFKGAFDKLEMEPKVFRVGKYKSYGERYDSEKLSKENREQLDAYLSGVWNQMLSVISDARGIDVSELNEIASGLKTDMPENVVKYKLVDDLKYMDEVIALIKKKCNISSNKKIGLVSHSQMKKVEKKKEQRGFIKEKVAVIYAWGDVQMGTGEEGNIGAVRISDAIRKAREDKNVKAVVLRVNSGGGSALASEVLWRELELTREIKPVVASMGDIAASGGYYMVVPADTILASPYTLTGSIGVVGLLVNVEPFLQNKLGITRDVVKTNPYADFSSVFRPVSSVEEASINRMIRVIYDTFINHVADARNMTFDEVHEIAQGRIWLAKDALNYNLIDGYGSLDDAIEVAANKAGLENYRITELPNLEESLDKIFNDVARQMKTSSFKNEMGGFYKYYKEFDEIINAGIYQAVLPFQIEVN